jgi:hypothetical protein
MESFKRKTAKEVAQWLDMEGLSLDVCDIFEGACHGLCKYNYS